MDFFIIDLLELSQKIVRNANVLHSEWYSILITQQYFEHGCKYEAQVQIRNEVESNVSIGNKPPQKACP